MFVEKLWVFFGLDFCFFGCDLLGLVDWLVGVEEFRKVDGFGLRCDKKVEWNGGEEIGDGIIDNVYGVELVGGCEVGVGEGGEGEV